MNKEQAAQRIGQRITALRKLEGISQQELADRAGLTRQHMNAQRDTVRDSIPYPVEVVKEVPAKLTWWQQTRLHLANIVLWLLALLAVIYVGKKHLGRLGQD